MIAWGIETLVATTVLMLLVLVLRGPVRKAFGPHMAYALWLLPAARLLLPPLPGDWQLSRLIGPAVQQAEGPGVAIAMLSPAAMPAQVADAALVQAKVEIAGRAAEMAVAPPAAAAGGPNIVLALLGLWALGALAFLAYHLIAHRRYTATLLKRARIDRTVAQGRVRVIETDAAHGPLAFGIFRKYVAFPRDFCERYDEVERDLALAHELGHHARGDLLANWFALFVLAIHWFNPVAWRAFRAFRADQEMACDALVLAGRAHALRHAYGRAIVKSAHGGAVSAACHLHTINEVKGRLRMLTRTGKLSPARIATGLVGVSALGLAALGLTASGTQAAEQLKSKVENSIGVKLGQDLPPPPPPAAAPEAPEAPEAPPAPPAPAPGKHMVHVRTSQDGKQVKKIVVVRADGSEDVTELPDLERLRVEIPEVRSLKCGEGRPEVEHRQEGAKKVTIICTDRIERVAANAERMAMRSKRLGMQQALIGLRHARHSVQVESNISDDQRAEALEGIDQAIAELEKDSPDQD
jgi:bla regulator protein blaR1